MLSFSIPNLKMYVWACYRARLPRNGNNITFTYFNLIRQQVKVNVVLLGFVLIIFNSLGQLGAKALVMHINGSVTVRMIYINNITTTTKLHPQARYIAIGSGMHRVTGTLVSPEI